MARQFPTGVSIEWVEYMELQAIAITGAVPCDYCNQAVGQYCKTANGQWAWHPHNVRKEAWRMHLVEKFGGMGLMG